MPKADLKWTIWFRPGRAVSAEDLTFWVTPSRDLFLMCRKESRFLKSLNYFFLLGIPTVFLLLAIFVIDVWFARVMFVLISALAIWAVTAKLRFSVSADRGVFQIDSWHFGLCTGIRRMKFSDDCRFEVSPPLQLNEFSPDELTLSNGRDRLKFFVVRSREEFSEVLGQLNDRLAKLIATREPPEEQW